MKRLITYTISLLAFLSALAQGSSDSATLFFKQGESRFDPSVDKNRVVIDEFIHTLNAREGDIDKIVVKGYASPEGNSNVNHRLSMRRCESVADYIRSKTGVPTSLISAEPEGVAWDLLTAMVENNPDVPARDEVLNILRNTPIWKFDADNRVVDSRKRQLMRLKGGRPYRWLLTNIFPQLRVAVTVSVYYKNENDISTANSITNNYEKEEGLAQTSTADSLSNLSIDRETADDVFPNTTDVESDIQQASEPGLTKHEPFHRVALKTNILYYAALLPNLEIEGMINKHWSVALEGDVAWYSNKSKDHTYQLAMVSPEVKYWIRPRAPWHGMFAGVFLGGGLYDFENGGTGYQGKGTFGGLSYGYMWPISRNFSLEASIGIGYLYTRYKEYIPDDGHFVYMRTKDLNYFGPLKLKFSLVWRFADSNK